MEFREYRGVRNVVIAEILKDNGTWQTGPWMQLSGVQAVSKAVNESSETHYYDNNGVIVVDSEGNDEYTLTLSVLDPKIKALIEGTNYNEASKLYFGTPKQKKYFALSFIGADTNGNEEINIVYKGKFSGGAETYNTKNDGTDATGVEYTFTSVYTTTKFEIEGKKLPIKLLQGLIDSTVNPSFTEEFVFGEFDVNGAAEETLMEPKDYLPNE